MPEGRVRLLRAVLVMGVLVTGATVGLWFVNDFSNRRALGGNANIEDGGGKLELDLKSKYSRIKVTKQGSVRTLWFVRDNGEEVVETMVDLGRLHDLVIEYTKYMFISYAVQPKQERVLIVGLGGGSMVHFLKHYHSNLKVDVVEIDPAIVKVADEYFKVRTEGNVKIITQDAFDYLNGAGEKYDVIYMDAFLKPSNDTTKPGVPLNLQTVEFYKDTQKKLTPNGLMVFNLNDNPGINGDIKNIRDAFPQVYLFKLSRDSGYVVVGSMTEKRIANADVLKAATDLDTRFKTSFSFRGIGQMLVK